MTSYLVQVRGEHNGLAPREELINPSQPHVTSCHLPTKILPAGPAIWVVRFNNCKLHEWLKAQTDKNLLAFRLNPCSPHNLAVLRGLASTVSFPSPSPAPPFFLFLLLLHARATAARATTWASRATCGCSRCGRWSRSSSLRCPEGPSEQRCACGTAAGRYKLQRKMLGLGRHKQRKAVRLTHYDTSLAKRVSADGWWLVVACGCRLHHRRHHYHAAACTALRRSPPSPSPTPTQTHHSPHPPRPLHPSPCSTLSQPYPNTALTTLLTPAPPLPPTGRCAGGRHTLDLVTTHSWFQALPQHDTRHTRHTRPGLPTPPSNRTL